MFGSGPVRSSRFSGRAKTGPLVRSGPGPEWGPDHEKTRTVVRSGPGPVFVSPDRNIQYIAQLVHRVHNLQALHNLRVLRDLWALQHVAQEHVAQIRARTRREERACRRECTRSRVRGRKSGPQADAQKPAFDRGANDDEADGGYARSRGMLSGRDGEVMRPAHPR
jgi:hypothetical protein